MSVILEMALILTVLVRENNSTHKSTDCAECAVHYVAAVAAAAGML